MNNEHNTMCLTNGSLAAYRRNVYSQNGEDGVIQEILKRLGIIQGQFVEFGAGDGVKHSNTRTLLDQGWSGVYMEQDAEIFKSLVKNVGDKAECWNVKVEADGPRRLDNILENTRIPKDFTLLSIDVDSNDFQIWESLEDYRPKIVIIEIESSIRPGIRQVHGTQMPRTSFSCMGGLAMSKGYALVAHTGNMIFVHRDLVGKLNLPMTERTVPELLFDYNWVINSPSAPVQKSVSS